MAQEGTTQESQEEIRHKIVSEFQIFPLVLDVLSRLKDSQDEQEITRAVRINTQVSAATHVFRCTQ